MNFTVAHRATLSPLRFIQTKKRKHRGYKNRFASSYLFWWSFTSVKAQLIFCVAKNQSRLI